MGKFFGLVKHAVKDFGSDDCMSSGAALAFYTIFSLPPLLGVVFYLVSWFGIAPEQVDRLMRDQLGLPVAEEQLAANQPGAGGEAKQESGPGAIAALGPAAKVVGVLILVFSATGILAQLQYTLNRVWEVEPDPAQGGIWRFLTKRVLSLGMIMVVAFLLLVSLVLTTAMEEILRFVMGTSPDEAATAIGIAINMLVAFVVSTLLFAAMFKILPDVNMRWRDVWIGAAFTAILFVIGKTAIGWYLQNSDVGSGWGSAAASTIGALVWVYYTSLVVLFGAELTQAWAKDFGGGIEPAEGAVRKVEEKRHIRGGQQSPAGA